MKKSLLALAACAMMASSADAMYIIGDPIGWSPMRGIEMTEADGGWKWTGTITGGQWFAFATQLMDSEDWGTFNSTYRLNPSANNTVAAAGEYALVLGGKDNSFKGNNVESTYFIKESDGVYTLTVTEVGEAPEPVDLVWGVVGEFNGWGEQPDFRMTEIRDGVWKATLYDFSGNFKFRANSDWGANLGAAEDDVVVLEGDGDFGLASDGKDFNIPEEVEEVVLLLDVNNMILTVDGLTPSFLALRGSMNDWNFEWSYLFQEVDDSVYTLYLDGLDADWKFKIADQDWAEEYSTGITDMTMGEMYELKPSSRLGDMGVDNSYTEVQMFFDLDEMLFWFVGEPSGVDAVNEIATGKARYFNLQGVEVSKPENGIFVRVRNGKSEKITVK